MATPTSGEGNATTIRVARFLRRGSEKAGEAGIPQALAVGRGQAGVRDVRGPARPGGRVVTHLLEGKNAVIYGGGGHPGRGVARTLARERATGFLARRAQAT